MLFGSTWPGPGGVASCKIFSDLMLYLGVICSIRSAIRAGQGWEGVTVSVRAGSG